ncbi:hypothetical protein Hanom_Chr16g01448011 [Helianthus anomalus]
MFVLSNPRNSRDLKLVNNKTKLNRKVRSNNFTPFVSLRPYLSTQPPPTPPAATASDFTTAR